MEKVVVKSTTKEFNDKKYLSKKEFRRIAMQFSHPAIYGKGRVLGDIISPLYKEVDA